MRFDNNPRDMLTENRWEKIPVIIPLLLYYPIVRYIPGNHVSKFLFPESHVGSSISSYWNISAGKNQCY